MHSIGVSMHTAGRMHRISLRMHTAGRMHSIGLTTLSIADPLLQYSADELY